MFECFCTTEDFGCVKGRGVREGYWRSNFSLRVKIYT